MEGPDVLTIIEEPHTAVVEAFQRSFLILLRRSSAARTKQEWKDSMLWSCSTSLTKQWYQLHCVTLWDPICNIYHAADYGQECLVSPGKHPGQRATKLTMLGQLCKIPVCENFRKDKAFMTTSQWPTCFTRCAAHMCSVSSVVLLS